MEIPKKSVLSSDEAADYLGIAKSTLYSKVNTRQIPFYKPAGKHIYFAISDLDAYLTRNKIESVYQT